jgi:hypothetical protein
VVSSLVVADDVGIATGFPNASSTVPVSKGRPALCRPIFIALIAVLGSTRTVTPGTAFPIILGYVIPFAVDPLDTISK